MKQIVVKFVVAKGAVSAIMYWLCGHQYTHVAIGPDEETSEFYSFTYKGFTKEGRRKDIPKSWNESYAYYILDISDSAYQELLKNLEEFKSKSEAYSYSYMSLICAFLGIPYKSSKKYTCSYFVAKLLTESNAYQLKRTPGSYLPNQLAKELRFCRRKEFIFG